MPLRHTVEEVILKNGAKGLIIDVPDSTVVAYHMQFRAGYDYADQSIQQVAHLLEHLSFGGNEEFSSAEAFSQEFSKNGATRGASTNDVEMDYVAEAAAMEWDRILDLMQLAITKPKFLQSSLNAEKGNTKEELVGQANNHYRVMWQQIRRAMGQKGLNDPEKIETIDRVQLSDITKHYQQTHTLNNLRFTVAGDLHRYKDDIISRLNSWDLPKGKRFQVVKNPSKSSPAVHIRRQDLPNLTFGFVMVIDRELTLSEMFVMGALNHILTGTFHSRIFGAARSQGICYSMGSGTGTDISGESSWSINGRVGFENAESLFKLIIEQLGKVIDGDLSEQELDAAKQYAMGGYQMRGQTVNSISNWYSGYYFDYDEIDYIEQSQERIQSVTTSAIVDLAAEFIHKGHWTLGGIGDISEKDLQSHYNLLAGFMNKKSKI